MRINSINSTYDNQAFCAKKSQRALRKEQKNLQIEQNYKMHQTYAKLALDCQYELETSNLDDFKRVKNIKNTKTGFSSSIYTNEENNEVVIAYRCTDNKAGVYNDIQMAENKIPDQLDDAIKVYEFTKNVKPDAKITITGHSLGGSLAQLVASMDKNVEAVTFDSYGTKQILNNYRLKDNKNSTNYTRKSSVVSSFTKHPGTTKTIKKAPNDEHLKIKGFNPVNRIKSGIYEKHSMENFENLSKSKYANEFFENTKRLIKSWVKNIVVGIATIIPNFKDFVASKFFKEEQEQPIYA